MKTLFLSLLSIICFNTFSQTDLGNGVTDWGVVGGDTIPVNKTAFVIDDSNNKWIGTNSGLYKFDNTSWTKFDTSNSGLPLNTIKCLYTHNNVVYIGTNAGLTVYDGTWVTYNTSNSGIPQNLVTAIFYFNNFLFVASFNNISKFDGINWTNHFSASTNIKAITNTPDNKICLAANKGIIFYSDSTWTVDTTIKNIICVQYDLQGNLWFSTTSNVYKKTGNIISSFDQLVPQGYVTPQNVNNISINNAGDIYIISSFQKTIYKFSNTGVNFYYIEQIQDGIFIHTIDPYERLWFCGKSSALHNLYSLSNENSAMHSNAIFANLDTNDVRAMYWSNGSMFWDLQSKAKYEVPKNSGKTSLFANGLWIGGLDNANQLHLAGLRYNEGEDYFPGPIMDSVFYEQEKSEWNKIWRINRNDILYHIYHFNEQGYVMPQSIAEWPGNGDTSKGQAFYLAPYKDANANQIYDPQNGDFPTIYGDQEVFFIINDAMKSHTETGGEKLGVEIHGMAYAFNIPGNDVFNHTTFLKYKVFNRSDENYHDVYIGNWNDMDLGEASDDYIGCDVKRSSFFEYNGKCIDGTGQSWAYGANPPAQSITFLGSEMPADGIDNPANIDYGINGYGFGDNIIDNERYGMCHFIYYNNCVGNDVCDPQTAQQYYNYLKGNWKDGMPMTFDGTGRDSAGIPCRFMFPGNSDSLHWGTNYVEPLFNPNGWSEMNCTFFGPFQPDTMIFPVGCTQDTTIFTDTSTFINMANPPGDRRGVGSVGPINLLAGEMREHDLAFVWGQNTSKSTENYSQLLANIDTIRKYFVLGTTPAGQPFETSVFNEKQQKEKIIVYPNPARDYLTIENHTIEKATYSVYDFSGRKIKDGFMKNRYVNTVDISELQKGIYILVINSQTTVAKKFIKE